METLILTGWGWSDYACAAALALRRFDQAEVRGVSTRRLPELLNEISGYKNILILGVGLTGNPELLQRGVKKLCTKGVKLRWISALPFPESLPESLSAPLEPFIDEDSVTAAVSNCFQIPCADLLPLVWEENATPELRRYRQLLDAAMYFYRNYQEEKPYGDVIRHIARRDPVSKWSDSERQMMEHYQRFGNRELVGSSESMRDLLDRINRVAPHDHARVMIFGESGTGKETVALQIHNKSPRRNEPFLAFNCACVASHLLESRFFGHEKGAFTGATERKRGLFELANGGTLFLDEIGNLPYHLQAKLLTAIQRRSIVRVGSNTPIPIDIRLICATNRNLQEMVDREEFREDLLYRINTIHIEIPPLRERKEDIVPLAERFIIRFCKQYDKEPMKFSPAAKEKLTAHPWYGNIRELEHAIEKVVIINDGVQIPAELFQLSSRKTETSEKNISTLEEMEVQMIRKALDACAGNLSAVAAQLGITRQTLYNKMKKFGL